MAITSAVCNSFKVLALKGQMDFTASTGDSFKLALFTSSATLNKSTTDYSTSNEMANTSGTAYTAGGIALTSATPVLDSDTAVCDFSDVSWTSATFTANGCLIYNTTTGTGSSTTDSVCSIAFGADKTVTSGTFTIQFPAAADGTAILEIA